MFGRKLASTRSLTRSVYSINQDRRRSYRWLLLIVLLGACTAYAAWQRQGLGSDATSQAEVSALSAQNRLLKEELEQLKMAVSHDAATRQELQRQLEERSAQLKKLQDEIGFLRKQRGIPASSQPVAQ